MIRRTLRVLTLTLELPALVCGSAAYAQDSFKLLSEKEIRARVIGKDTISLAISRQSNFRSTT
jgi:hypothetical protein